jgi:hypothetical protein
VLDANNSGVDMLLDLVCQLLYIPLFLEWIAATTEEDDQIHGKSQMLISFVVRWRGERDDECVHVPLGDAGSAG